MYGPLCFAGTDEHAVAVLKTACQRLIADAPKPDVQYALFPRSHRHAPCPPAHDRARRCGCVAAARIDEGNTRYRDATHLWVWLDVSGRDDNLLCAVLVLEDALIVKTVLHHWEPIS